MSEQTDKVWAEHLTKIAADFPYPQTPPIAQQVQRKQSQPALPPVYRQRRRWATRWGWATAVVILLVLLLSLLAIPPVRAAILEFIQIGAVKIFNTPPAQPAPTEPLQKLSLGDIGTEITLAEAQEIMPLLMPTVSNYAVVPDAVYQQALNEREAVITLVWFGNEARPQIALTQIGIPSFGIKWASGEQIVETAVNDLPAVWIEGPHLFSFAEFAFSDFVTVDAQVLLWTEGNNTLRLEGDLTQAEAVGIAESLR